MVAVDTNVLLHWLVRDDAVLASKADRLLDQARPHSVLLDRIVLAELNYVLKSVYGFGRSDIRATLSSLLADDRFVVPAEVIMQQTLKNFVIAKLSFEDSYLLALKQDGEVSTVLTFDKALQKRLADEF